MPFNHMSDADSPRGHDERRCGAPPRRSPRPAAYEADLSSHMNTTRSLCTLYGPTNRAEPDNKMVTECAKCVPALRDAAAPAMFALFVACARERIGRQHLPVTASWANRAA